MSAPSLIGVDIGTQGTKALLVTPEGECLARAFVPSDLRQRGGDVVEEDPETQVESVCTAIRRCVGEARIADGGVAAIVIAGQMAGVIGVGADGCHVTPYDSWLDTRCAPYIRQMNEVAGDRIVQLSGGPPGYNHGPKILRWKTEFPEVYDRIAAFVQPGGYAAMRLCGLDAKAAYIDTTYLHFSGFADSQGAAWDQSLCNAFGVDRAKLPRIVAPHETIGQLSSSAAGRCGLRAGTSVLAGSCPTPLATA